MGVPCSPSEGGGITGERGLWVSQELDWGSLGKPVTGWAGQGEDAGWAGPPGQPCLHRADTWAARGRLSARVPRAAQAFAPPAAPTACLTLALIPWPPRVTGTAEGTAGPASPGLAGAGEGRVLWDTGFAPLPQTTAVSLELGPFVSPRARAPVPCGGQRAWPGSGCPQKFLGGLAQCPAERKCEPEVLRC